MIAAHFKYQMSMLKYQEDVAKKVVYSDEKVSRFGHNYSFVVLYTFFFTLIKQLWILSKGLCRR